ncbi:ATP-dependent helicase HrpB [Sneathiella sp. P13V-1]|uniref:ATP-dependent helicase HrpB n=1 Tax=Sneathiella sp. P13V-1 TaxID=2697366 RepID=UPI00187BA396|nr:ATP-dependent helicase HrpB [Sneathiella sp. P13V-1]MBE7638148.1 ATP-dependent helicase HrpB [Sneathiella sp. P13V-1]
MSISLPKTDLPVEAILPILMQVMEGRNTAVLQAPPGAGKTTTVPLWLMNLKDNGDRKILMLEPRRLAARAAACRMADLLGEEVGETVGYRVRLDVKVSQKTKIEVVTEGILTRKLQQDPELSDVAVVIFDEFHERNLNTDLGLALCRQSQEILRDDLKILVMSATLDAEGVAKLLDDAPIVTSEGRQYPVETRFYEERIKGRMDGPLAKWIEEDIIPETEGDILVFLPGAGEINRLQSALAEMGRKRNISILPLFGNLSQKDQDRALLPDKEGRRKIVLSTDIAETSLTIEGVRVVVDSGLSRKPRFDPNSGMSRLETKRISRASADQRTGRAGRQGPGVSYRFWPRAEDRGLIPHSDPEIANADLCSLALELAKWGAEPDELDWMTPPPSGLLAQAQDLLKTLDGLGGGGAITPLGEEMVRLPLHPRLAHMILKAKEIDQADLACDLAALLSERDILKPNEGARSADIRLRLNLLNKARDSGSNNPAVKQVLRNADDLRRRFSLGKGKSDPSLAGVILAFAYPDRIGELRKGKKTSYRLSGGRGVQLDEGDPMAGEPYMVVADLDGKGREARIYLGAAVTYHQLQDYFEDQINTHLNVQWDAERERIIADEERRIGALVLESRRIKSPDADQIATALADVIASKDLRPLPWDGASEAVLDRLAFVRLHDPDKGWPNVTKEVLKETVQDWLKPYLLGKNTLDAVQDLKLEEILLSLIDWDLQQELDQLAPAKLEVPTGSKIRLDYSDPEAPVLAVRMQEIFGMADLPKLANGKVPLTAHLLSPARRPAQITKDLAGFWKNSYKDVKKDLKGQYPRHYWPDDPLQAEPTSRAKPRGK